MTVNTTNDQAPTPGSMDKLLHAIKAAFPGADVSALQPGTKMSQIPGWDSMNAINLVLELETALGYSGLTLEYSEEQTFGQVCDELRAQGLKI